MNEEARQERVEYPHHTSRRCSVCGSLGERFSPSGSKALVGVGVDTR